MVGWVVKMGWDWVEWMDKWLRWVGIGWNGWVVKMGWDWVEWMGG